jgi:ParB family chromosome partitioning protein
VTNYLRLLRLPDDLQELLQKGKLSTGHARALLGTEHVDVQRRLARRIIEQDLSVRATERMVRQTVEPKERKATPRTRTTDPNIRAAETKLRRQFGTQVRILQAEGSSSGKIEFEFYNAGDLDRLYMLLTKAGQ